MNHQPRTATCDASVAGALGVSSLSASGYSTPGLVSFEVFAQRVALDVHFGAAQLGQHARINQAADTRNGNAKHLCCAFDGHKVFGINLDIPVFTNKLFHLYAHEHSLNSIRCQALDKLRQPVYSLAYNKKATPASAENTNRGLTKTATGDRNMANSNYPPTDGLPQAHPSVAAIAVQIVPSLALALAEANRLEDELYETYQLYSRNFGECPLTAGARKNWDRAVDNSGIIAAKLYAARKNAKAVAA